MSSPFGDDAEHPDRPDTLDFWRLSQVVLKLDGAAQEGDIEPSLARLIDPESLNYMAGQRATMHARLMRLPDEAIDHLAAFYMSGVVAGIEFQKEGGHRDG